MNEYSARRKTLFNLGRQSLGAIAGCYCRNGKESQLNTVQVLLLVLSETPMAE
ncbi:hypothetical protein [Tatumella sp. UBA2305]|uniref:hypothetical protein n=1 Tax=Tatumella sp. UBA2305 TaxID=1947647 RepID=UPI0025DD9261|nr:hypothetical protein [Tatumella sp. UBA2305]